MPDPKYPVMRPRAPSHTEHDSPPRPPLVATRSLTSLAPPGVAADSFLYQVAQATEAAVEASDANARAIASLQADVRKLQSKDAEHDRALEAVDTFRGEVLKNIAGLTTDVGNVRAQIVAVDTKLDGIKTSSAGAADAALDAAVATKKIESTGATKRSQLATVLAVPVLLAILQAGREWACAPPKTPETKETIHDAGAD